MDLIIAERENAVLGQDFLTWLWYRVEDGEDTFTTPDGREFVVAFEQKVSVQGGDSENVETATVTSPRNMLAEAMTGLARGKKVSRAHLRVESGSDSFTFQIKAQDLSLSALKTPKVEDGKDDPDGAALEKYYLMDACWAFFDTCFRTFLELRLSEGWPGEAKRVADWIRQGAA
ncbi:MAG: hypothetical protein AB7D57_06845 [Desulfovibrionaceae bacterium]